MNYALLNIPDSIIEVKLYSIRITFRAIHFRRLNNFYFLLSKMHCNTYVIYELIRKRTLENWIFSHGPGGGHFFFIR